MSHASSEMMSTWRLVTTVPSPAPIAVIAWLHKTRSPARNSPASRASQRLRAGSRGAPRLRSASARAPRTGRANPHRPRAVMLADVSASRISTAELEIQAAPAMAAAAGGIGLRGIGVLRRCLTLRPRPECHDQKWVMVVTLSTSWSGVNMVFAHDTTAALVLAADLVNSTELTDVTALEGFLDKHRVEPRRRATEADLDAVRV